MPAFRRLLERLDEFILGVPNHDLPSEQFDALEPQAQHELLNHIESSPSPLFVQDDSVTTPEPEHTPPATPVAPTDQPAEEPADQAVPAPEPQPAPPTNDPQQVVDQQPEQPAEAAADPSATV